jgi:hypothetical protein
MTYQSAQDTIVRQNFLDNGYLPNSQDTNYRAIKKNWPVFGFSNELGDVKSTPATTVYTILHAQENAIYFNGANGLEGVPSLWTSYFSTELAMVCISYSSIQTPI